MADLVGQISYNTLTFPSGNLTPAAGGHPASGYIIERFDDSDVDVSEYLQKRALQEGMDAGDVYLGARRLVISAGIYGSTKPDFFTKWQAWREAFNPVIAFNADTQQLGFLPFQFGQPTTDTTNFPTSNMNMLYYARPLGVPRLPVSRDMFGTASKGMAWRLEQPLICRDPRKYLSTNQTVTISTSTQTLTHRGDFPTWPTVSLTLSGAGSATYKIIINSTTIGLNLSGASADTYLLTFSNRTFVKQSDSSSVVSYASSTPTYPQILPHNGSTIRHVNATNITSATIQYREAWI